MSKHASRKTCVLYLFLASIIAGLIGYSLGNQVSRKLLINTKEDVSSPSPYVSTSTTQFQIENPEIYIDKQKAISFVYPKTTHVVKNDSESERSRNENSGIPQSFLTAKGFAPPKVVWALKVEDKDTFQGRYGVESPTSPFAVWVFDNSQNLTVEDWFEMYWYYPFTWGSASQSEIERMRPLPKIVIDGEQTTGYDMGPTPRGYLKLLYVKRDDKIYLFQLLGEEQNSLDYTIATTFKFLLPKETK